MIYILVDDIRLLKRFTAMELLSCWCFLLCFLSPAGRGTQAGILQRGIHIVASREKVGFSAPPRLPGSIPLRKRKLALGSWHSIQEFALY